MPDVIVAPGRFDFGLYQGDTFACDVFISEVIDEVEVPVDLTGHTLLAQVRVRPRSTDILAVWSAVMVQAEGGHVRLTLTSEESTKISRDAVYDFQTSVPSGGSEPDIVRTWLVGDIHLTNDTSRPGDA